MHSLWFVQWDFTRRDHLGNLGRVSRSGPVNNAIALALAECSPRPYAKLIRSNIPGPSSSKSAHSATLRSSPPSTMRVSPIGPSAANPTRGELLAQLETLSQKPRSVKRKTPGSSEKDRPVLAKVSKLGAASPSPSTHV